LRSRWFVAPFFFLATGASQIGCGAPSSVEVSHAPSNGGSSSAASVVDRSPLATSSSDPTESDRAASAAASAQSLAASTAPHPVANLPALPPSVELPSDPACSFATTAFRGAHGPTELYLSEGGRRFGSIWGDVAVDISIPVGKAKRAGIAVRPKGMVLRGFVDAADVALHPALPFVIGELASPWPKTELFYSEAKAGELTLSMATPSELIVKAGKLVAKRSCGDVELDVPTFDTVSALFGKRSSRRMSLSGGATLVAARPGGPAIATLLTPEAGRIVTGYEVSGTQTLFEVDLDDAMVFGWVSSSRLTDAGSGGRSGSIGIGRMGRHGPKPVARVKCTEDVPLIVELKEESATVGVISAGTIIDLLDSAGERTKVSLEAAFATDGARFCVRTLEVAGCTAVGPSSP
jgi:hypothetical protein